MKRSSSPQDFQELSGLSVRGRVVFAVARPWVRDSWGAALLGAACLAPTVYRAMFAARGLSRLDWRLILVLGAVTFVLGSMLGLILWHGSTRMD